MTHQEFSLLTKDGLDLFAQAWDTDETPQAAVCLVHGLGEHSSRYQHVAEAFNQAGFRSPRAREITRQTRAYSQL